MLNYLKADIYRVLKKKSYLIASAVVFAIYLVTLVVLLNKAADYLDMVNSVLADLGVIVIGITVFTSVFSDDFSSKAMQTVIGFGTSRRKLVLSRFIEYLVILGQALLALTIIILVLFAVTGHMPEVSSSIGYLWKSYLLAALSASVAMIFVYGMKSPTLGLIVFIAFIVDIFGLVFMGLSFIPFLAEHNIDPAAFLPGSLINAAFNEGKTIDLLYAFIGYIVLPQIIAVKLFENRELEF